MSDAPTSRSAWQDPGTRGAFGRYRRRCLRSLGVGLSEFLIASVLIMWGPVDADGPPMSWLLIGLNAASIMEPDPVLRTRFVW